MCFMTRREAREQAFILLFEKTFNEDVPMSDIIYSASQERLIDYDDFSRDLAIKTCENLNEIDSLIESNLRGWKLNRVSRVSVVLMRAAICEMLYFPEIPNSVSINEAVELCKVYGGENDYSFINGVLGSVDRVLTANAGKE